MIDLTKLPSKYSSWPFIDLIIKKSLHHDINPLHIIALIQVESSGIPTLLRYEKKYQWIYPSKDLAIAWKVSIDTAEIMQKTSWGLCQIMGAVAVEHGLNDLTPYNQPSILLLPEYGIEFGCRHWNKFKKKYSGPLEIYACYNAGSLRKKEGIYENHEAVLKFKRALDGLERDIQT